MIESNQINVGEDAINCQGGLYGMTLNKVKGILIVEKSNAQKLSLRAARFAVFNKLLKEFLTIWQFKEHDKATIYQTFKKHYEINFAEDKKYLSLNEEFKIHWNYVNNLCFED